MHKIRLVSISDEPAVLFVLCLVGVVHWHPIAAVLIINNQGLVRINKCECCQNDVIGAQSIVVLLYFIARLQVDLVLTLPVKQVVYRVVHGAHRRKQVVHKGARLTCRRNVAREGLLCLVAAIVARVSQRVGRRHHLTHRFKAVRNVGHAGVAELCSEEIK